MSTGCGPRRRPEPLRHSGKGESSLAHWKLQTGRPRSRGRRPRARRAGRGAGSCVVRSCGRVGRVGRARPLQPRSGCCSAPALLLRLRALRRKVQASEALLPSCLFGHP
ncbi:hypothetical protein MC885_019240 [Smutsia gigantea]|nr:hypothetical protein MC885_019240 [Smutsia gigantea]